MLLVNLSMVQILFSFIQYRYCILLHPQKRGYCTKDFNRIVFVFSSQRYKPLLPTPILCFKLRKPCFQFNTLPVMDRRKKIFFGLQRWKGNILHYTIIQVGWLYVVLFCFVFSVQLSILGKFYWLIPQTPPVWRFTFWNMSAIITVWLFVLFNLNIPTSTLPIFPKRRALWEDWPVQMLEKLCGSLFIFADIVVKHRIPRKWWQI